MTELADLLIPDVLFVKVCLASDELVISGSNSIVSNIEETMGDGGEKKQRGEERGYDEEENGSVGAYFLKLHIEVSRPIEQEFPTSLTWPITSRSGLPVRGCLKGVYVVVLGSPPIVCLLPLAGPRTLTFVIAGSHHGKWVRMNWLTY